MGGNFFDKLGGVGKAIGGELASGVVGAFGGGKKAQAAAKNIGGEVGAVALPASGALFLKTGGRVPGKKGAPKRAIVHGGEFMLPVGVKPTKSQVKAVAELKAKEKKKK